MSGTSISNKMYNSSRVKYTRLQSRNALFKKRLYSVFQTFELDYFVEMNTAHSSHESIRVTLMLFNKVLAKRGSEFGYYNFLEIGLEGTIRSSIYYLNPMQRGHKGGIGSSYIQC